MPSPAEEEEEEEVEKETKLFNEEMMISQPVIPNYYSPQDNSNTGTNNNNDANTSSNPSEPTRNNNDGNEDKQQQTPKSTNKNPLSMEEILADILFHQSKLEDVVPKTTESKSSSSTPSSRNSNNNKNNNNDNKSRQKGLRISSDTLQQIILQTKLDYYGGSDDNIDKKSIVINQNEIREAFKRKRHLNAEGEFREWRLMVEVVRRYCLDILEGNVGVGRDGVSVGVAAASKNGDGGIDEGIEVEDEHASVATAAKDDKTADGGRFENVVKEEEDGKKQSRSEEGGRVDPSEKHPQLPAGYLDFLVQKTRQELGLENVLFHKIKFYFFIDWRSDVENAEEGGDGGAAVKRVEAGFEKSRLILGITMRYAAARAQRERERDQNEQEKRRRRRKREEKRRNELIKKKSKKKGMGGADDPTNDLYEGDKTSDMQQHSTPIPESLVEELIDAITEEYSKQRTLAIRRQPTSAKTNYQLLDFIITEMKHEYGIPTNSPITIPHQTILHRYSSRGLLRLQPEEILDTITSRYAVSKANAKSGKLPNNCIEGLIKDVKKELGVENAIISKYVILDRYRSKKFRDKFPQYFREETGGGDCGVRSERKVRKTKASIGLGDGGEEGRPDKRRRQEAGEDAIISSEDKHTNEDEEDNADEIAEKYKELLDSCPSFEIDEELREKVSKIVMEGTPIATSKGLEFANNLVQSHNGLGERIQKHASFVARFMKKRSIRGYNVSSLGKTKVPSIEMLLLDEWWFAFLRRNSEYFLPLMSSVSYDRKCRCSVRKFLYKDNFAKTLESEKNRAPFSIKSTRDNILMEHGATAYSPAPLQEHVQQFCNDTAAGNKIMEYYPFALDDITDTSNDYLKNYVPKNKTELINLLVCKYAIEKERRLGGKLPNGYLDLLIKDTKMKFGLDVSVSKDTINERYREKRRLVSGSELNWWRCFLVRYDKDADDSDEESTASATRATTSDGAKLDKEMRLVDHSYTDYSVISEDNVRHLNNFGSFFCAAATQEEAIVRSQLMKTVSPRKSDRSFPALMHQMLECSDNANAIKWMHHGRSFIVKDPEVLARDILPRYFNHSNMKQFNRRLREYGFKRITKGRSSRGLGGVYYSEMFLRGRLQLSLRMKRQDTHRRQYRYRPNPDDEPDFENDYPPLTYSIHAT